jgi:nickel/cobalt exporter
MSLTRVDGERTWTALALVAAAMLLAAGAIDIAFAQGGAFTARPAAPPPPPDGIVGWILAKQAAFYQDFSRIIRAAKSDGSAVWTLLGVSFLYGIFHAAGPGHGKAVISSYIVANDETWWRGVILSFASAFLQALVAVLLVGIAVWLFGATSRAMQGTVYWIEIVSYGLIALLGARLVWVKGRSFFSAMSSLSPAQPALAHAGHAHDHGHHDHDHAHHAHGHHDHAHHDHGHHDHAHAHPHGHPEHVHDEHCGHNHGPTPDQLAGPGGWRRGLSAIFAVGLRPCSGAILVLVFALAQGLFWVGAAATFVMGLGTAITVAAIATIASSAKALATKLASGRGGYGSLAIKGLELAAAVFVLAFGVLLLMGYIASERLGMA